MSTWASRTSYELIESETVFDGRIISRAPRPGADERRLRRRRARSCEHPGAVGIVALDDQGRVVLVNQYRHPVRARLDELPAGLLDVEGEPALDAAKRELPEEAGLRADEWHVLLRPAHLARFHRRGHPDLPRARPARGRRGRFRRRARGDHHDRRPRAADQTPSTARSAGSITNAAAVAGLLAAVHGRATDWRDLRPADAPWRAPPVSTDKVDEPVTPLLDRDRQAPAAVGAGLPRPPGRRAGRRGQHAELLPPRPRALPRLPRRARRPLARRGRSRPRSAASWPTCARATPITRRCRRPPPPGPSSPSAACTASRCARDWSRSTSPREVRPPAPPRRLPKAITVDDVERLLDAAGYAGTRARPARPRAARAALRHRRAHLRGRRAGRRRPRPDRRDGAAARQGRQAAARAARVVRGRRAGGLPGAGPPRAGRGGPGHAEAVPQRPRRPAVAAVGVGRAAHRGRAGRPGRRASRRTPCGTPSPPT